MNKTQLLKCISLNMSHQDGAFICTTIRLLEFDSVIQFYFYFLFMQNKSKNFYDDAGGIKAIILKTVSPSSPTSSQCLIQHCNTADNSK